MKTGRVKEELARLGTEKSNLKTRSLSGLSTEKILRAINDEDSKVPAAVRKEIPRIRKAVDVIVKQISCDHGRLVYLGAGTSGRLGVIDGAELLPTFGAGAETVRALIAGGKRAMFRPVEGAEDSGKAAVDDLLRIHFSSRDVLLGISASGRTPYVLQGLKYAKGLGAHTISLTVNRNSLMKPYSQITICPDTGPEALTGSTRMKAGTAQKLVLNMISTAVMIKLGRVHGNLMTNLRPLSQKLKERQKRILMELTGLSYGEAERKLVEAGSDLRLAIMSVTASSDTKAHSKVLDTAPNSAGRTRFEVAKKSGRKLAKHS